MRNFLARVLHKIANMVDSHQVQTPIDITDDYVNWLSFANAGMLHRGNVYCFDYAIQRLPGDCPLLEIGSLCGLSTSVITNYLLRHGVKNRLITVDKWVLEGSAPGQYIIHSDVNFEEYSRHLKQAFMQNVKLFSRRHLPWTIELYSDEFFNAWREGRKVQDIFGREMQLGGPLGFCYIDGDHRYEFAIRDFENCHEFLESGGFILFDDSEDGGEFEGVQQVVAEVNAMPEYALITKNPNYFFLKK